MPRATPTSNPKKRSRKYASKQSGVESDNLHSLRTIREAEVSKYNSVKNTTNAYNGHRSRGKGFLKNLVAKRKADGDRLNDDGICTTTLEKAFDDDGGPNRYSALALEMFLVQKCFNEGCGKDTADGIHGAFAALWDNIEGGKYDGEYSFDEVTGEVKGCPARASNVRAVVQSIKTRDKSKGAGANRNHAEAMTLEELQCLMRWSTKECPDEWLTGGIGTNEFEDAGAALAALKHCLRHGFMRGFMPSGYTLWTRCFELLSLQARDLQEGCTGPAPYYIPHFKVELLDRKGWQHEKGYDGPRTACLYDIYQQEIPEMDMHTHLLRWKTFLESVLGRKLAPDDYLFPHIGVNGVIRTDRQMSYDSLQAMLSDFCKESGTERRYTTHSFRRGGAQYRFMFAPIGQRWSLNRIRWWGGWAVGEHCDTLIKYLVDSLQSFENGHGDALHPIPLDPTNFFMGDQDAMKPATREEIRQFGASVNRNFQALTTTFESALSQTTVQKKTLQPTLGGGQMEGITQVVSPTSASPCQVGSPPIYTVSDSQTTAVSHQVNHLPDSSTSPPSRKRPVSPSALPIAGVSIPSLGHAPGAWRRALKQWSEVDLQTGLALKDWPAKWYCGLMRTTTGSLRSQRQVIVEEYERLGSDENQFLETYPDADRSMTQLLKEIRQRTRLSRSSKNGTPEARSRSGSVMDE
ncbi:hypothetical protein GALMADRAFT_269329 [Galerina marginata CBS 339.88]|uniref:Tyr recombinase domain-containing protein n=1 Tax=Galerina marginata (strain CBS 339.88) TaxID=685588 RepID=A0A067SU71_GALM3|nr:hypothetical protein GALMADRAFT_269329 [Galerina marginata CBS 339.88]